MAGHGRSLGRVAVDRLVPHPREEKWGRPCGRPHSRRLVGTEGHLAARRLDAGSEKLLRALKVGF